ncbi:MAG TPA: PQQ-binding-like beta-propeller repeat protein [Pirellulales bacterium]|nr:PQQ-binding-like beta-propeller repeat protein [Pirellulales bacterium]
MSHCLFVRRLSWLVMLACVLASGADWPRFRGPNGSATSAEKGLPVQWSEELNLVWKTDLPGPGASSPITNGDRVFLTCYSGYGVEGAGGSSQEDLLRHLLCIDRATGAIVWDRPVRAKLPEDRPAGMLMGHGYTSSTPASDGEQVYVFFGKSGVFAFDLEGTQRWHADVGEGLAMMGFGSGASPIVHGELVIVNASVESSALVALDRKTGKEVWKAAASAASSSWSTPILVEAADGQWELVTAVPGEIWGMNPETGKLLWYAAALPEGAQCTSLVAAGDIVYAVSGMRGNADAAVRVGGRGDVSQSHIVWKANLGAYVPSPVVDHGYLYWVTDKGIACCVQADSGELVYKERVPGARDFYSSVVLADGKLYAVSRTQGTFVLSTGPKFELLAHNELASDSSLFNASPAVSRGQLFLRSNRAVYCIGNHLK